MANPPLTPPITPRPGIMDIAAYVPGEAKLAGHAEPMQLAANENVLGPAKSATAAYTEAGASLHRYPDGAATVLRNAIADAHGLDADRIICGAGSDEILSFLGRSYAGPGDEVLYSAHGFLMYPIITLTVGATPVAAPETGGASMRFWRPSRRRRGFCSWPTRITQRVHYCR